jgi:hypothetical protein
MQQLTFLFLRNQSDINDKVRTFKPHLELIVKYEKGNGLNSDFQIRFIW